MTEDKRPDTGVLDEEAAARRDFLKKTATIGATAPAAVALLLSAKPNKAQAQIYGGCDISDIRLKRDIALLSRLDNGLGVYRYRYQWSDQVYVGVMAQEVEQVMPDAVVRSSTGYLAVDYGQLGLQMMTWEEWSESANATLAVAA